MRPEVEPIVIVRSLSRCVPMCKRCQSKDHGFKLRECCEMRSPLTPGAQIGQTAPPRKPEVTAFRVDLGVGLGVTSGCGRSVAADGESGADPGDVPCWVGGGEESGEAS